VGTGSGAQQAPYTTVSAAPSPGVKGPKPETEHSRSFSAEYCNAPTSELVWYNFASSYTHIYMRWAGHVARIGDMRKSYERLVGKGRDYSEELGVDGKVIIDCILGK
jgi:hypothetical protein